MDSLVELMHDYQEFITSSAVYPNANDIGSFAALEYLNIGLIEEMGELAGKFKKIVRDSLDIKDQDIIKEISYEIGDGLYYISQICSNIDINFGLFFQDIEAQNVFYQANYSQLNSIAIVRFLSTNIGNISNITYMLMIGEDGFEKFKRTIAEHIMSIIRLYYFLCLNLNIVISDVVNDNKMKCISRKERNVIHGSGDNR